MSTEPVTDETRAERGLSLPVRAAERLRGVWAAIWRNRLLTIMLLCGTSVIATSAMSALYYFAAVRNGPVDPESAIRGGLASLDAGDYEQARRWAVRLWETPRLDLRQRVYPPFLHGVALAHEAGEISHQADRRTLYLVAARFLEEARDRGLPPAREPQGLYLLAYCLFQGGRYAESLPALQAALDANPARQHELYRLLSAACARLVPPDFRRALRFERLALEDPTLNEREREEAMIRQAEYWFGLGDAAACRAALDSVATDSPLQDRVLVLRGRLAIWEGDQRVRGGVVESRDGQAESRARYREAIDLFERARSADHVGDSARQSLYLLAICHQKLGDEASAKQIFERLLDTHYRSDEAMAAELSLAEIAQAEGGHDAAVARYVRVLAEVEDLTLYHNPWLPLAELRQRLAAAQSRFREAEDFAAAVTLGGWLESIFPADEALERQAHTHQAWAAFLMRRAETESHAAGNATREQARHQFRRAGGAYRRLADLRFATPQYPDYLRQSGQCYLRGQHFDAAIRMLTRFLAHAPRRQTPPALLGLAESYLASGQYGRALHLLDELIQAFPKHPETYRARLLAALASERVGKREEAKALLSDNLHHWELTPRSHLWRQSLFAYGAIRYREALLEEINSRLNGVEAADAATRRTGLLDLRRAHDTFLEAITSLEEAVARYPRAEEANEARYQIAESYRRAATFPGKSRSLEPTAAGREALGRQQHDYLEAAARMYQELQRELTARQQQADLSDIEQALLRNARFAHADVLFDLERYTEAIDAYTLFTHRYPHSPASIEALMQIASCYRRLDAPEEARGTVFQAGEFLARIEDHVELRRTTRFDREQWTEVINWLSRL